MSWQRERADMPTNILRTYEAYQQQLIVYNQVGDTLGQPHTHRCSIPQGCPYSMTLIALLMRPWILHMRANHLTPRVLADDLFISASRDSHADNTTKGMQLSRTYFKDIGAKVADNKCFLATTCPTTRHKLKKLTWDAQGTQLKVVTHFRDLGAHVGMDRRNAASTTTQRIQNATAKVRRLKWLPINQTAKTLPSEPPSCQLPSMAQKLGRAQTEQCKL